MDVDYYVKKVIFNISPTLFEIIHLKTKTQKYFSNWRPFYGLSAVLEQQKMGYLSWKKKTLLKILSTLQKVVKSYHLRGKSIYVFEEKILKYMNLFS